MKIASAQHYHFEFKKRLGKVSRKLPAPSGHNRGHTRIFELAETRRSNMVIEI
jgi:hypothetical protein